MPHVALPPELVGIRSAMATRPETAAPMLELAEVLLRGESTLTRGERELIAAYVSHLNGCQFCTRSHGAFAARQLEGGHALVDAVRADPMSAEVSPKLRALLVVAGQAQRSGKDVTRDAVDAARAAGATDREVHDTVLITAAFCMFNRYVDGLATVTPDDPAAYEQMADRVVSSGYRAPVGAGR